MLEMSVLAFSGFATLRTAADCIRTSVLHGSMHIEVHAATVASDVAGGRWL